MAQRLIPALQQVIDSSDVTIGTGYNLYTYETGTTTEKATYSDESLTVANTNPIVADANGSFGNVWVSDLSLYKIILTDADDVLIATYDPVDGESNSLTDFDPMPTVYMGTTSGDGTTYTLTSTVGLTAYNENQSFKITFHVDCEDSPTLNIDGLGAISLTKYQDDGTTIALSAGDINGSQTYDVVWNPEGNEFVIEVLQTKAATSTSLGTSYLSTGFITIANNATDSSHDIDFSSGNFTFSDGSGAAYLTSTLTKQIDSSWAEGSNAGGLFTGTVAVSTWYHCFIIYNPTTQTTDAGFDTSITAANIPSGYTKYSYRGSILTDSSANILTFIQSGNEFYLDPPINIYSGSAPTTSTLLSVIVPPNIFGVIAFLTVACSLSNASNYIRFIYPNFADATPTVSNSQYRLSAINSTDATATAESIKVPANTSQQIAWRANIGNGTTTINSWGFSIPINLLI